MDMHSPTLPDPTIVGDPDGPYFEELVLDETTGQRYLIGATTPDGLERLAEQLVVDPTASEGDGLP